MGQLHSQGCLVQGVQQAGQLDVSPCVLLRKTHPPQKVVAVDTQTVLGPMEQGKGRPMGVWRQTYRPPPAEVLMVQDRKARAGSRYGLPRRSGFTGLLVGKAKGERQ